MMILLTTLKKDNQVQMDGAFLIYPITQRESTSLRHINQKYQDGPKKSFLSNHAGFYVPLELKHLKSS